MNRFNVLKDVSGNLNSHLLSHGNDIERMFLFIASTLNQQISPLLKSIFTFGLEEFFFLIIRHRFKMFWFDLFLLYKDDVLKKLKSRPNLCRWPM